MDRQVAKTEGDYTLRGSALHSPRVREGPRNVTSQYASHSIMYCKRSLDWKDYRNVSEDWEHTEVLLVTLYPEQFNIIIETKNRFFIFRWSTCRTKILEKSTS